MATEHHTVCVFADVDGYHWCDSQFDYLDARGKAYKTKADALRAAAREGYTHAYGSGTYWAGTRKIPARFVD